LDQGYDYVAHVEGDSILLPPVSEMFQRMHHESINVMSLPVSSMTGWIETGLMLFDVRWLQDSDFVRRYDWESRTKYPEPEAVTGGLVGDWARLPWHGMRDDFNELTADNVGERGLDWLTHAPLAVMQRFAA
jgi:hypothetical protein